MLKKTESQYYQHVFKCYTRGDAILDLCFTNVREAYTDTPLNGLGGSDHNLVHLLPKYKPIVQRIKPKKVRIKQWTDESLENLRDCFDSTDWKVFIESSADIDELTETVSAYIKFCEDALIPSKLTKCYSNNKPWITKEIKQIINRKKGVFGRGNRDEFKAIQKELNNAIKEEKRIYKEKVEQHFTSKNMKSVWNGLKLMSGYTKSCNKTNFLPSNSINYANELNHFHNRFDCHDFTAEINDLLQLPLDTSEPFLSVSENDVRHHFHRLNPSKAAGPDNVSCRILKNCSCQLSFIYTFIFNLCFTTQTVPSIWKQSCIIPVPKSPTISCLNDLRPVALTSVAMKVCERFVLDFLKGLVSNYLDPLQFAYCKGRSTEDALLFSLDKLYSHLERSKFGKVSARVMYFDFSSAFNTIQPHLLAKKLLNLESVPFSLVRWIVSYLTKRSQYVKVGTSAISNVIMSNTGVPQGTVLAPFLFTVYTSDIRSEYASCPLVKFADDTALIGLISNDDDTLYLNQLNIFVNYCNENFLELNVKKTKEMIIDFRTKHKVTPEPVLIGDCVVERVSEYKYLGVVMDEKLNWNEHVAYVEKRLKPRFYCFRKLNSFNVNREILAAFYNSIICSVWNYCIVCWAGNTDITQKKVLDGVIKRVGRILGEELPSVDVVYLNFASSKVRSLWKDISHPLHSQFNSRLIPRSGRLRSLESHTNRYKSSFMGTAISIHNRDFTR